MIIALPPLVVSRRPRQTGMGWDDAPSWFGGRPRLGNQPWPRGGEQRRPFHFVAQIDLAEVAREVARRGGTSPLPDDGALAFFIGSVGGRDSGAVVHVPRSELGGAPTEPPPDAPAVLEPGGDLFPAAYDDASPRLFPRWPVDVAALDVAPDADDEAQAAAVARRFTRRQYFFTASAAYRLLGDAPRPIRWYGAHHYAACLRAALRGAPGRVAQSRQWLEAARATLARLRPAGVAGVLSALGLRPAAKGDDVKKAEAEVARQEARVAELEGLSADFERFVRDVNDWVRGTQPWQPMPPDAVATLTSTFERGRTVFGELTRYRTPRSLDDLETETLLALATADDDRAYATMPEPVRTLIDTQYLLPTGGWHQMFGKGVDIQGNAAVENEGNVMLLQLVYDDMMHWRFGDKGAYQFWIPPEELARGNWSAARLTFEGG